MALNWPGLLAWSTKYHDGTAPSQFKKMSDEDRAFLEKAMQEAFGKIEDPNEVMRQAIEKISAEDRTDESILTALEIVDRCCDDPDVARNIEKIKGLQPLLDVLRTHAGPIRIRTLEILALLFSNNPHIQKVGVERGAMPLFLDLVKDCPKGSEQRSKAFRALVALVRQVAAFEESLLRQQGGLAVLVECLDPEEDPRTQEKAASFARSLAGDGRLLAEEVPPLAAALSRLFGNLAEQNIQYRETLTSSALELALAFPDLCPAELASGVQARLTQLAPQKEDSETEYANLEECLKALSKGVAESTAAAAA